MNKFGRRILAALITSSLVVTPVLAAPSVDDLQKSKASAQSEVNSLQSQLQSIVSKITQLEADLTTKGEEIIQAQADLEQAQEDEKTQYAAMKLRIKYMYEAGDATALESLVSSEDFSDLLSKAEYVQSVHGYDRDKLEEYVATKQKIADLKDQLETEQSQLESMQTEYETEESNLTTLIDSKQAEVADLDSQIQEAAEKAAKEEEERQKRKDRNNFRQHLRIVQQRIVILATPIVQAAPIVIKATAARIQAVPVTKETAVHHQAAVLVVTYPEVQYPVHIQHLENRMYGERQDLIPSIVPDL